ncbi:MAG: hypothetical protein K2I03_12220 [Lachnospiraceae bacterium]|nr:hypothetical protein [Lachnospiraceae bacterium]MDE6252406.1 hypothetical protein [Lachnospiraceae bacterium]
MKKFIKSTVAVTSAIAMAFTMAVVPSANVLADDVAAPSEGEVVAPAEPELFVPDDMAAGEAHYTVAGGFGKVTWNPLAKDAEMTPVEGLDGVYSFTAELPVYAEETEYQNRFKICRIDNTILDNGWSGSLCVGTTTYADNQSQIRILNLVEGLYTIYFDSNTGAVIVKDQSGQLMDLAISWVGFDNETNFLTPEHIANTTVADWPADKVKVDKVPAIDKINEAFANKLVNFVPDDMPDGEVHYTVAGGFGASTWTPLARNVEMKQVPYEKGLYYFTAELPAYDEEAEWQNRFKICKIDNTILDNGWSGSLCVGTTTYADNQSQIRILNKEAGTFTIYFDPATGGVLVKDAEGKIVDLSISWVGFDNETKFMTPEEIAKTTVADWPADKVKVDKVPDVAAVNTAVTVKADTEYQPDTLADGKVFYTVAGGFGQATWTPLSKLTTMNSTDYSGVYSFTAELPAYDEETEWQNRFKICKIDNTILDNGWSGSLCVGTTTYADNQSQIRILNKEAGTFTIYFDSKTGAVVVKDAAGSTVDLSISWVGFDNETKFMTPEEIAKTTVADWPADKVKVDKVPDVAAINAALVSKLSKPPVQNSLKLTCSTKTLYTGKSGNKTKIKATVTGSSKKVTWTSSKPSVATVSKSGTTATVAAKKAGTTVITAKANGITKKVTIKVKNPTITVKQGSKKVSTITLKTTKSTTLKVTTSPSKAGIKVAYANSASKKLIKISTKSGKVTVKALKKKGTAKIKITSGGATKTVNVKVK